MSDIRTRASLKTLLGAALIIAPALILVSNALTHTIEDDETATYLANIAANEGRYYAASMIGVVGALFVVGGVLALVHLVRQRYPRYAKGVGGLAILGALTMSGVWLLFSIVEFQMAQESNRAAMVTFFENMEESAAMAPLFITWMGTMLGMVLLGAALIKAGTVPRWMPGLMIAGFVLGFPSEGALTIVADAVILAGMGAIGLAVLRTPLEAWEEGTVAPLVPTAVKPAERLVAS